MYIPEFWAGFVIGAVIGGLGLLGLAYIAATGQRKRNRRP